MAIELAPTDVVAVLRTHLEEIATALDCARGHFMALDLADGYRQGLMTQGTRPSRATRMMEKAIQHTDGYLTTEEVENE